MCTVQVALAGQVTEYVGSEYVDGEYVDSTEFLFQGLSRSVFTCLYVCMYVCIYVHAYA